MDFSTDENLSPSKNFSFHLPKSVTKYTSHIWYYEDNNEYTSYMGYADLENLYIFYGNGERVVTFINFKTKQLRTIPRSKLITKSHLGSGVQVGNLFLIAGSKDNFMTETEIKNMEVKTNLWSTRKKIMIKDPPTLTSTDYTENCLTSFNRTHFVMIGNIKNDTNIFIIELKSMMETYLATLPIPKILYYLGDVDEYRIGCSVMFNKSGSKELATVSRPFDPYERDDSFCFILNLDTLIWTQFNCNIKFYGNSHCLKINKINFLIINFLKGKLVVMKGVLYYFNVLNKFGHLGYFYDNLRTEWIELPMDGIKYTYKKNFQDLWSAAHITQSAPLTQELYPIVIVPYFG